MNPIFEKIRTSEERDKLIGEIDILIDALYQNSNQGFDAVLKNKVRAWVSDIIKIETSKEGIEVESYLKKLKTDLLSLSDIKLVLAFEPTDSFIDKISAFFRKNIDQNLVLDISYNPGILGGCIVIHKGKYKDLSLKRIYEEEYAKIRQELFLQLSH
jgi:F0F1-type ATP synthase delta subunit